MFTTYKPNHTDTEIEWQTESRHGKTISYLYVDGEFKGVKLHNISEQKFHKTIREILDGVKYSEYVPEKCTTLLKSE